MNLIILCAIFCVPTTLAFQVSFYELDRTKSTYCQTFPSLICTPHQFIYQRGDKFIMYLELRNYTSAVTRSLALVRKRPGTIWCNYSFTKYRWLVLDLTTDQVTIDVEICTKDGCLRETILNGTTMPETASVKAFTHNDICLNKNKCVAFVTASRVCTDIKPQPCAVTDNIKPLVLTPAPLDKRHRSINETYKMLNTTVLSSMDTLNSVTPTPNIASATDNSKGAPTSPSHFPVLMTVLITAAVALISLLVIALWHYCRKTYNSPGLPQILPTNANRYYENVVFRDGCQQETEQLEQRASEDPQPSEHYYEEINNY